MSNGKFLKFCICWFSLSFANFLYQAVTAMDYELAAERSFFELVGLVTWLLIFDMDIQIVSGEKK